MSHGGNAWPLVKEQGCGIDEILDFSADLNPLGPPPGLAALLEEASRQVGRYPEPTYQEFREAAARAHGVDPANILPGNGTAELIHLISRWQAGGGAAVVVPTFTEYERAVLADGGEVIPWPLEGEEVFSPPSVNGSLPFGRGRLLFLCNPNNPTGTLWPLEELLRLARLCDSAGRSVVVDEAYMDFVEDRLRYSMAPFVERFERLIVLRSMTKGFAVPGLRVGYLAASSGTVQGLRSFQPPWPMNTFAAWVGTRLLRQGEPYLAESRDALKGFRISLWDGLTRLGPLGPCPSCANFFLCRVKDPRGSNRRLAEHLKDRGILIRTCDDFTGLEPGRFIRIAVRPAVENERLIRVLGEVLSNAG